LRYMKMKGKEGEVHADETLGGKGDGGGKIGVLSLRNGRGPKEKFQDWEVKDSGSRSQGNRGYSGSFNFTAGI